MKINVCYFPIKRFEEYCIMRFAGRPDDNDDVCHCVKKVLEKTKDKSILPWPIRNQWLNVVAIGNGAVTRMWKTPKWKFLYHSIDMLEDLASDCSNQMWKLDGVWVLAAKFTVSVADMRELYVSIAAVSKDEYLLHSHIMNGGAE